MKFPYYLAALSACVIVGKAQATDAANAGMRYAALSVQRDDEHNQQTVGTLSLTLGDHAWVQAGGGQSRIEQAGAMRRPTIVMGGIGAADDAWQFNVNYTDRHDGEAYSQRDWTAAVDWRTTVLGIGIDGATRRAHLDSTLPVATSSGGVAYVPVSHDIDGNGIGMHVRFNLNERITLFAAGMKYHYTDTTRQSGNVTVLGNSGSNLNTLIGNALTNQPLLSQTLVQPSIVTRETAALDRSFDIGATYRFDKVGLTAEYFNDKVLGVSGTVDTLQLKAGINVTPHWIVTPGVGRSRSDQYGGVNYGMVTVAYSW